MKRIIALAGFLTVTLFAASFAQATVVWHDPYLNWDLTNYTGVPVNDLAVIVDDPNYTPNVNDPNEVWADVFETVNIFRGDYDGDGDQDTMIKYSSAINVVNPDTDGMPRGVDNDTAHGGLYMKGSGAIIDAYWTWNCNKVGNSIPVTYEKTEIRGDPEVHMHLTMSPTFEDQNPGAEVGWMEIRTFVNIPAEFLSLGDLNIGLDLDTRMFPDGTFLRDYEVDPYRGQPGLPGNSGIQINPGDWIKAEPWQEGVPESFFDVFLAQIPPEFSSPDYESLLVSTVVGPDPQQPNENIIYGQFWNLNPQSPEPTTLGLLALGALAVLKRKRKS